jgi:ParB family chromosome partitioning protein
VRRISRWEICPRIREAYRRKQVDATTIRHLTMASKSQKAWLALFDDPEAYCPTGHQLKQWLFGGSRSRSPMPCSTRRMKGIVSDLFGEDSYFADAKPSDRAECRHRGAPRGLSRSGLG